MVTVVEKFSITTDYNYTASVFGKDSESVRQRKVGFLKKINFIYVFMQTFISIPFLVRKIDEEY